MAGCIVLGFCLYAHGNANAQGGTAQAEELTYLEFSAPVSLPGVTLGTGSYMFKRADANNPDVIQVFDRQGTKFYGMWLTVRSQRREPTDTPQVQFIETPEGAPHAIRSWYYPQRQMGHEFIYSKAQAMRLAKSSGEPVLMTDSTAKDPASLQKAEVQTVSPSGEITPFNRSAAENGSQVARADTAPTTTATAAPPVSAAASALVGTAGQTSGASGRPRRESLPQTGSSLWLVGAIALASLTGGMSLRAFAAWRW